MSKLTYAGLLNKTIDLYQKDGSLEAYRFVTENAGKVKGNQAQLYNFRYALASASGLKEEALALMKEAIMKKGFWYEYEYLLEDEDLIPLHKYDEFQRLANLCKEREELAKKNAIPDMKIIKNDNNPTAPKPLLIALHGDQENIEITEPKWNSVALSNYLLALPQSSQVQFSDGYVWDDVEKGAIQLEELINRLKADFAIDFNQVIIGGFSAGARVALHAILTDKLQVSGFIFVAPWLPEMADWEQELNKLREKGLKGYVICGSKDEDCVESTNNFVDVLNRLDFPHFYKVVEGLDHDYPSNFDEILQEAISYINQ